MNLSERQKDLVILIILTSFMLAIILNTTYSNLTVQWLFYQIPAFLVLLLSPTWRVAIAAILTSQFAKAFFTIATNPTSHEMLINLSLSMLSNIMVYCIVAHFLILINKKDMEAEDLRNQIKEDKKSMYGTTIEDIKKSKKKLIDSMLEDEKKKKI